METDLLQELLELPDLNKVCIAHRRGYPIGDYRMVAHWIEDTLPQTEEDLNRICRAHFDMAVQYVASRTT